MSEILPPVAPVNQVLRVVKGRNEAPHNDVQKQGREKELNYIVNGAHGLCDVCVMLAVGYLFSYDFPADGPIEKFELLPLAGSRFSSFVSSAHPGESSQS